MKTARWILCIIAFSALIIGCGEDTPDFVTSYGDTDSHDPGDAEWWQIVSINGKQGDFAYGNVFFNQAGAFTHVFTVDRTVELSPDTVVTIEYFYTNRGRYTTRRNKLTITESSTQRDVDVRLDPEATGQPEIEGVTLEALRSDFAAEIENGFPLIVFKSGTEYTWQIEDRWLTLSSPQQRIVLWRVELFDELETSSAWW